MQKEDKIKEIGGIPLRYEDIGFAVDEMIACGNCSKNNPPNRLNCFYCGERLQLPVEIAAGLKFRPTDIEEWEPGVNIVFIDGSLDPEALRTTIAINAELVEEIARSRAPFPLFRVRGEDAGEVAARLAAVGAVTEKIADETLDRQRPPSRLKGVTFHDNSADFYLFNSDQVTTHDAADVKLIIYGSIFKSSSEATIRRKRKETKHVDENFSASDHALIDLYAGDDRGGFRILPHGFDFSCLRSEKSLLAVENMKILKERLKEVFPNAIFDDTYERKLSILDHVWPRTVTNTSKGVQRVGMKVERSIGESVSNEEQFTRYSRMRRELI